MKSKFTFLILLIFLVQISYSQSVSDTGRFASSITLHMGFLKNSSSSDKQAPGFGFVHTLQYRFPLLKGLSLYVGPSIQLSEVKNRLNELRWPDDVVNGQWVPGLSYEEYKATFISGGAALNLHLNFPVNNPRWTISGGTSARYVIDYWDKLTLNESGNVYEYTSEELVTEINKLQVMVDFGISYLFKFSDSFKLSIGPVVEYGLVDFLKSAEPTLVWEYRTSYPVFFGLRVLSQASF